LQENDVRDETHVVPLQKRQDPNAYMDGFASALEDCIKMIRAIDEDRFTEDFGDGYRAGLQAASGGIAKSLHIYGVTRQIFMDREPWFEPN
jgi:hypothetical protein